MIEKNEKEKKKESSIGIKGTSWGKGDSGLRAEMKNMMSKSDEPK